MTRPREFLDRSIDIWQTRLVDARARLEALRPFIERPGQIIVIDTSAFIEGEYFTDFNWRRLVCLRRWCLTQFTGRRPWPEVEGITTGGAPPCR
jgi:hypothetical protein